MNSEQLHQHEARIERVRVNLLRQLERVRPLGLTPAHLQEGLIIEGMVIDLDGARAELEALEEAGLVRSVGDSLNSAVQRYKLTEAGRVALSNKGFIR